MRNCFVIMTFCRKLWLVIRIFECFSTYSSLFNALPYYLYFLINSGMAWYVLYFRYLHAILFPVNNKGLMMTFWQLEVSKNGSFGKKILNSKKYYILFTMFNIFTVLKLIWMHWFIKMECRPNILIKLHGTFYSWKEKDNVYVGVELCLVWFSFIYKSVLNCYIIL